jgi:hypothetical protein
MDIKKIGYSNRKDKVKHIGIPKEWGTEGDKVLIEIVNEKELKMTIVN